MTGMGQLFSFWSFYLGHCEAKPKQSTSIRVTGAISSREVMPPLSVSRHREPKARRSIFQADHSSTWIATLRSR